VHPQAYPDGLDCTGKRVIVIGSGASAVSLVPALAKRAARVTMVQRSPSYIVPKRSTPSLLVQRLRALAPALAGRLSFWSYVVWDAAIYFGCHLFPSAARATLLRTSASLLDGGRGLEHFTPRYGPWKQRMCWDPDGGFHELYRTGAIDIVTGVIHSFTEGGVRVESSVDDETHDVAADIVVAATGYNHGHNYPMQKIRVSIDGKPYNAGETKCYKDIMLSDVPNFAYSGGYFHQSNILAVDLALEHVCKLIRFMHQKGYDQFCPRWTASVGEHDPDERKWWLPEHDPGYFTRLPDGALPGYGASYPWSRRTDPLVDLYRFATAPYEDGHMEFQRARHL